MKPAQLKKTERDPMELAFSIDIVMDVVVQHLKVRDLLSCRFVSKCWNRAASAVLRRRSTMIKNISEENQLMKLQECMDESMDFPFTGLKFDKPWSLNSSHAMEFFQNYGDRFKRLCLDTVWCAGLHVLAPFINHLPRLVILEVGQCQGGPELAKLRDSAARHEDDCLKLPSVQILRFSSPYSKVYREVLREVLAAAPPSIQIECLDASDNIISVLRHAGKLRAVSVMKIVESFKCVEQKTDQYLSTESPSLTKLDFTVGRYLTLDVLERVLFSSQHTLKELRLNGTYLENALGTLWDRSPVFPKLTMLNLCVKLGYSVEYLFRGAHGHKFQALKELQLGIASEEDQTYLSDGLFILPNVTRIDLEGFLGVNGMKQLAQMCPNVVDIGLQYDDYCDSEWGHTCWSRPIEIWCVREFKFLKKLRIWNCIVKRPTTEYTNMDSFLTGIPFGICENLLRQKEFSLHLINSPFKEAFGQVVRQYPSIVELQNLKELIICVKLGYELEELPQETPFMSMLSIWYALEMMPNLRTKFVYEEPSLPTPYEGRYRAVLEAQFKHVQPYIKLEPFFY